LHTESNNRTQQNEYRTTGNVWQAVNIGNVQNSVKDWQMPFIRPVKIGKEAIYETD
jgi:hypothetical protein